MIKHRLKTNTTNDSINDRLKYNPEIVEFFLHEGNLRDIETLRSEIRFLQEKGIKLYLHHPSELNGRKLDILSEDKELKDYYLWSSKMLAKLCKEEGIRCIIHCHYADTESSYLPVTLENTLKMKKAIEEILIFGRDVFLWEDTIEGLFAHTNPYLLEHVVKPLNLDLNLDISHSYIACKGNNDILHNIVKNTAPYVKYLHVVDSLGQEHDGLELGKGTIEWWRLKDYFYHKDFVYEILLENNNDCTPMVRSAEFLSNL